MRFSVITISFNAQDEIERTIRSVLEQDFVDYEYLFIDGASTDRTNDVIRQYKSEFEKKGIQVTHQSEKDKGIADAFDKGVKLASGEIVVILNAGDVMLPQTMRFLDEHFTPDLDVLYGNMIWHDDAHNLRYIRRSKNEKHLMELKYRMVVDHPACYISRKAYEKYGLYDTSFRFAMDTDLVLRMYLKGARFLYVDREFTEMWAGGNSDVNLKKVLAENARIARNAGDPRPIVWLNIARIFLRHHLAHFIRFNFGKKEH